MHIGRINMNDIKKFAKASGVYFFGNVLMKIIIFLMLPLYTKYINPADYGTYDLYIAYVTFLCSVLFLDIWSAIMRYMFADNKNKEKPLNSGIIIFIISSLLYTILVFIIGNIMNVPYLFLVYLYGILMNVQNLFGHIARGYENNTLYSLSGIISTFITVISNIVLIVLLHFDYSSLYISSCIGFFINSLIIFFGSKLYQKFNKKYFDTILFIDIFKYSLPLCLNSVAYWFLTSYNKVVISNKLSSYDNGLYAIAGKFSVMLTLVTSCFQMAWQELSFSKASLKTENLGDFYTKAIDLYFKFLFIGMAILLPVIYIIFPYMTDSSYSDACNLVPMYLLATIFSILSTFLGSVFGTIKETKKIFTTTVWGSIVNVLTINILVRHVGVNSASISLFLGFFVTVVMRIRLLKKFIPLHINLNKIARYFVLIVISMIAFYSNNLTINILNLLLMVIISLYVMKNDIVLVINSFMNKNKS